MLPPAILTLDGDELMGLIPGKFLSGSQIGYVVSSQKN